MGVTRAMGHRSIKEPIAGPWDWQSLIPRCQCELDDLRIRASAAAPIGINLSRFFRFLEAEITGKPVQGAPTSSKTLANYRRFLYELELDVDHDPVDHNMIHGPDVDLEQLPCAFGGVTETAENPRFLGASSVNLAAA